MSCITSGPDDGGTYRLQNNVYQLHFYMLDSLKLVPHTYILYDEEKESVKILFSVIMLIYFTLHPLLYEIYYLR